jgi:hypothetical protein
MRTKGVLKANGLKPPFNPNVATVVADPPGPGAGHWAGAPGAFAAGDQVYLVYRLRWPRPRRGGELGIARGDGERFQTIWRATREDFASPSIERCAILRDGRTWRLYVSYVDGVDGRWRIDVIEAGSPESFDPTARRLALSADSANAVAVKEEGRNVPQKKEITRSGRLAAAPHGLS